MKKMDAGNGKEHYVPMVMEWSMFQAQKNNSECIVLSMNCLLNKSKQDWSLTTFAEIANALIQTTLNKYQLKQILLEGYHQSFKKRIKLIVNTGMNYLVRIFTSTQNEIRETVKNVQTLNLKCAEMGCLILDFANVEIPRMPKVNANLVICTNTDNKRGRDYVA